MLPIAKQFYRSMYVSLGLACACLWYAELEFLPEMSIFAGAVLALLVVAYLVEGRWALSIRAANVLGGGIAIVVGIWVADQLLSPNSTQMEQLPWPTWMLPFLGPLLMLLVPAKLFRPKHNGDFWGLQGIGLVAVALGCALTGDPIFGVLMVAYFISAVWSLTLFSFYRHAKEPNPRQRVAAAPPVFTRSIRWAAAVASLALVLFLITPRVAETHWELSNNGGRLQTGINDNNPAIDLNRYGTLMVNRERAFQVRAFYENVPNPPPKLDVDPGQRWRQTEFNYYDHGRWVNQEFGGAAVSRRGMPRGFVPHPRPLADLGPGQFFLEFHLPGSNGAPRHILAEPIASRVDLKGDRRSIESPRLAGASRFPGVIVRETESGPLTFGAGGIYEQVVLPAEEPGLSPPERIDEAVAEHLRNARAVPKLRAWSQGLMRELVAQGRLPKAVLGTETGNAKIPSWLPPFALHIAVSRGWLPAAVLKSRSPSDRVAPQHYEAVCRAFESYLARSGRFKYSMTLTRRDAEIDPIEDFVLNTREGHCVRFATALTLMLRSVGIPAQVVLGYRGYESAGNGVYDVLQCHAHSWVEAIVYRESGNPDIPPWRWLTLDPTPAGDDSMDDDFTWSNWWEHTRQGVSTFFKTFIVDYDADQQERTRAAMTRSTWWGHPQRIWQSMWGPWGDGWIPSTIVLSTAIAIALVGRKVVRRMRYGKVRPTATGTTFYDRMLSVVRRGLDLAPAAGQTAAEFAVVVADHLRLLPATCVMADVPAEATAMYYRVRFGGRPLEENEFRALNSRVEALATAIKKQ